MTMHDIVINCFKLILFLGMDLCPICSSVLEERQCAPCYTCGGHDNSLKHLAMGVQEFSVYDAYNGLQIVLCDRCEVNFSSYNPVYFGFRHQTRIGLPTFKLLRTVANPQPASDKFCGQCNHRAKFIDFVVSIRKLNAENEG